MDERKLIIVREQDRFSQSDSNLISNILGHRSSIPGFMNEPDWLGIESDGECYRSSYFVGACNLPDGLVDLIVLPKYPNLDFMTILAECIAYLPSAEYFSKCYGIYNSEKKIECAEIYDMLSPLLAMHYILILDRVVQKGLCRNYITREENIKSKVKGRIATEKDWRKNVLSSRRDRVLCRFTEFSVDVPINKLLKKAYLTSVSLLNKIVAKSVTQNKFSIRLCQKNIENAFHHVNCDNILSQPMSHRRNKLNSYYPEAISLAKEIIGHNENCIADSDSTGLKKYVRPFWIDMSRLFEVYVLSKLQKKFGQNIEFQVHGDRVCADYIHRLDHQIIDAKYKSIYLNNYDINDIREISGNARDVKICRRFHNYNGEEPDCIIIYPDSDGVMDFGNNLIASDSTKAISHFRGFYKIGIQLPLLSNSIG